MVEFWGTNRRLGSLCEMLDASLSKRAAEWNIHRGRDPLDPDRCRAALERTGAALVFGRAKTVAIPTIEISLEPVTDAIDLGVVLPDWSHDDVQRLLGRPAFDPATFGRSQLHNDNEGELCLNLGDGVNQAANLASSTTSIPSRNLAPLTTFGNWF
jgi:hypothetical protein